MDLSHQGAQVAQQLGGEVGLLERVGQAVVRQSLAHDVVEAIPLHERVEHVRGNRREGRDFDGAAGEGPGLDVREQQLMDAEQPGPFPAYLPQPDAREPLLAVEEAAVELRDVRDDSDVHLPITPSGDRDRPGPLG